MSAIAQVLDAQVTTIVSYPEQGWSLMSDGTIALEDGGTITTHRDGTVTTTDAHRIR